MHFHLFILVLQDIVEKKNVDRYSIITIISLQLFKAICNVS